MDSHTLYAQTDSDMIFLSNLLDSQNVRYHVGVKGDQYEFIIFND